MKKSTLLLLILAIVCILSLASCGKKTNNTTDSTASTTASAKPTEKVEKTDAPSATNEPITSSDPTGTAQTAEPTDSTVEPTTVPTQEPTKEPTKEPTVAPTTAPTSKPTAVAKPTADPAIYPDDFGEAGPNNSYRTDGKVFFWTKTRHMVEIPEELQGMVYPSVVDEENEQALFNTGFITHGTLTYYAIREGVIYKLNQGKIVKECFNGYDAFGWLEEDGTACSIGVRSKYWNEVYIEGTNCKGIFYYIDGKLVVVNQDGEIVDPNKEDVLRGTTIVN